jgi:hypothetical protein
MPMQHLPRPQSSGEKLAKGIGAGLDKGVELYGQHKQQQQENEFFQREFGVDTKGASPDVKKLLAQSQLKQRVESQKLLGKQQQEEKKKQEEQEGLKTALDWLDENAETHSGRFFKGVGANIPGTKRHGQREEYSTTGFWAADQVFTHFNKGTVSKEKLKVIQNDLAPRAGISSRENKARIAAMRRMTNLPSNIPKEIFEKELNKEIKAVNKIEKPNGASKGLPPFESFFTE